MKIQINGDLSPGKTGAPSFRSQGLGATASKEALKDEPPALDEDQVLMESEQSSDSNKYLDMLPDEPVNRDLFEKLANLKDHYSYHRYTNTARKPRRAR